MSGNLDAHMLQSTSESVPVYIFQQQDDPEYLFSKKSFQQRSVLILHSVLYHMDLFRIEVLPAQYFGYGWQNQAIIIHTFIFHTFIIHIGISLILIFCYSNLAKNINLLMEILAFS